MIILIGYRWGGLMVIAAQISLILLSSYFAALSYRTRSNQFS
jgi:hypothetical protein